MTHNHLAPKPQKRKISRILGLVLSTVLILAISGPHSTLEAQNIVRVPKALQKFTPQKTPKSVPTVPFVLDDDTPQTLADYRGTGLVLNFWATWCAPCVREMPHFDRLQIALKNTKIRVLTMSEDRGGVMLVRKFYEINELKNLPVLRDTNGKLMRRMGVRGLPTTILIDANGQEVGRVTGPADWDQPEIIKFIRTLLSPVKP